jgi:cytochrome P450
MTALEQPPSLTQLLERARLDDPTFFSSRPFDVYAELRGTAPVLFYKPGDFWALSKHEDIVFASRNPQLFTSTRGIMPDEHAHPERSKAREVESSEFMLATDPPRHGQLRRMVSSGFTPRAMRALEDQVRGIVTQVLDEVPEDKAFDFYEMVSQQIPIAVICALLGLPRSETKRLKRLSMSGTEGELGENSFAIAQEAFDALEAYFTELLAGRRERPSDDLLSLVATAERNGEVLSLPTQLMFCIDLLTAGNETTDPVISGGTLALIEHPGELERLRADPELLPNAVEEMLRYVTPVVAMCRTVTQDLELRGEQLHAGDYVVLLYVAANRDEEVFEDPEAFDVSRENAAAHVAFGSGPHTCIGAGLARMELRIVFKELLARFSSFELVGDVEYLPNLLIPGIRRMPLVARR